MKKIIFIPTLLISLISSAQRQWNVLDWKSEATLNTYLIQQMHYAYDERRKNFQKAVQSKQGILLYIAVLKKKFTELWGSFPEPSHLNAKITGVLQEDGYHIEKIIYESFSHHHVTANLYLPDHKGKLPAALLFCGHEDISKATESYQKTAILLAKNGFVVFVIDPISQSERYQITDKNGKPLTRGGTTEHTLLNESSNLFGGSSPTDELWDNHRGLDYLLTRPEVDSSRIGCIGNSGGGMQTIYFAAFDSRIKLMVPCSYLSNRERTMEMTGPADGCAQIPGEGKLQLELDDYLIAAAPKPLLVLAGRYDFIDYSGVLIANDELKKVYTELGYPKKFSLFTYDDGHGISKPKREAAVSWFRKWFYNDPSPVKEHDHATLSDKELMCTASGQLAAEFPDEISIPQRNLQWYDFYAAKRAAFSAVSGEGIGEKLKELTRLNDSKGNLELQAIGNTGQNDIVFQKMILRKQDEPPLPVLTIIPKGEIKQIIIWLNESGKIKIADSATLVKSYLADGNALILADLRGIGETEDKAEFNDPKYFNKEYRNTMTALHIGAPLPGQRTRDVLTIMEYINSEKKLKGKEVEINADGPNCLAVLFAAVFEKGITRMNFFHTIRSFHEILEKPTEKNWYSYILPGVLKYFDLQDIVKLVGVERVKFYL